MRSSSKADEVRNKQSCIFKFCVTEIMESCQHHQGHHQHHYETGKQISAVPEKNWGGRGGWTLHRTQFSKEQLVFSFSKSQELLDLHSESVSLIKQLLSKMDLGFKSSTTLFTVFCKTEVFLKAENWDLNLQRKCPEDSHHGGEDII